MKKAVLKELVRRQMRNRRVMQAMLLQLIQPSQEEKARRLSKVTFLLHHRRMNTGPGFWRSVGEGDRRSGNASNNKNPSQSNQKQKPDPRENRDRSGVGKNSGANQSGRRPENRNTGKGKANKHAIFCNGS